MPLIIEDGLGVQDADSYVSQVDALARAIELGLVFPTDIIQGEAYLRQAAIYMNTLCFKTDKQYQASINQLSFPRLSEPNVVPANVIDAQVVYASAVSEGYQLFASNGQHRRVTSKSVGNTSWTYADGGRLTDADNIPMADIFLSQYLCSTGNGLSFKMRRG